MILELSCTSPMFAKHNVLNLLLGGLNLFIYLFSFRSEHVAGRTNVLSGRALYIDISVQQIIYNK